MMMVLRGRVQSVKQNPILLKEWRSKTRRQSLILFSFLYLIIQGGLVLMILLPIGWVSMNRVGGASPPWSYLGVFFFLLSALVEGLFLLFVTPALTAGAISGEKQRQTYEILRTTTLSARRLVSGKLLSAFRYPLVFIVFATAFQLLTVFTEGIHLVDVLIMQMMMTMTALAAAMLGLLCSVFFRSTLGATMSTYTLLFFMLIGIPILVAIGSAVQNQWYYSRPADQTPVIGLAYVNHLVGSINLSYAVIQSALILDDSDSYLGGTRQIGYANWKMESWFPSPWYLYLFWQSVLSWGLYRLATWQVGRIPN